MTPGVGEEDGFTLIELLVATLIVGILISAIGAALLVGLKTVDSIGTTLRQSHDAQLLATWLEPDITSAGASGVADTAATWGCSGSDPGGTTRARFQWVDQDSSTTYNATYRQSGSLLTRYFCIAGGARAATVVVHNLQSASTSITSDAVKLTSTVLVDGKSYVFTISGNRRR